MIIKWKKTGKLSIVGKLGILFLIGLIISIPGAVSTNISGLDVLFENLDDKLRIVLLVVIIISSLLSIVVMFLLQAPFYLSQHYVYLKVVKEEKLEIKDAFYGFKFYKKAVVLYLKMFLIIMVGFLLFIIPGIILLYKYQMAFYLLCENPNLSTKECLKQSSDITAGYKSDLFLMDLSFIGWDLLAILTFGILYIWLTPYKISSHAAAYLDLNPSKLIKEEA